MSEYVLGKGTVFQIQFLKSMRFRITLGIIAILSVILLVLGQITISEQRDRMMSQMEDYGRETANFMSQISSVPLQKFSYYQLENYVAQLERGQLISYCEIFDGEGNPLAHSTGETESREELRKNDDVLVFTAPIRDNGVELGRVELGLNLTPVISRMNRTSLYITLAFWIELVLIGVAVSLFVHRSLVSPLLKLALTTSEIAAGRFITSSQAKREDELGVLAKTINSMSKSLADSYQTLERKVIERTAALNSAKNSSEATAENLELMRAELQALLDNSPVGILFVTLDREILRVNQEFTRIFGYSAVEVVGMTTRVLYENDQEYQESARITYKIIERDGFCQVTLGLRKKDGGRITCALRGRTTKLGDGSQGVIWSIEDITFRLKMEEEVLKVKKMESIGVLAGGIAHDFNNILVAIIGNISLAERVVNHSPKVTSLLENAKNASLRAKDLTIKLLTFAKGGVPVKSVEYLPEVIQDSASFVLSGSNVNCEYDFEDGLWPVPMDKGQINQVIQNLILNADQSMMDGGTVTIDCRNVHATGSDLLSPSPGRYVVVRISDTGHGIEQQDIANIFDPYFSTKEKSSEKGSGLGLSIVHSIVTKHGGTISVRSTPGTGTTFTLCLPAGAEVKQEVALQNLSMSTGRERVLVMDDEETVQTVAGEMLNYLGYEAIYAENGEKAIELYKKYFQSETPIDVVIMDLTIPGGMGGEEAVAKILQFDGKAKVVVSSGYSDDPVVQNYREAGFVGFISKPYQLADFSETLSHALGSS